MRGVFLGGEKEICRPLPIDIWFQKGEDINGEDAGDNSGGSVSINDDGNTIVIGAAGNDDNGNYAGHVRVYGWNGVEWFQKSLDIDGEIAFDSFGHSVSICSDGKTIAVGAPGNSSGFVRIYLWNGSEWAQRGEVIHGESFGDRFGSSVAVNNDGYTVAIGAVGNDGNGFNAGHVRVFERIDAAWSQKGLDIDGEAAGDYSVTAVSISSDGDTVAIAGFLMMAMVEARGILEYMSGMAVTGYRRVRISMETLVTILVRLFPCRMMAT